MLRWAKGIQRAMTLMSNVLSRRHLRPAETLQQMQQEHDAGVKADFPSDKYTLLFLLDGAPIYMRWPGKLRIHRAYYNNQHKRCAWRIHLITSPTGRFVDCTRRFIGTGKTIDRKLVVGDRVMQRLQHMMQSVPNLTKEMLEHTRSTGKEFAQGGDKAYHGVEPPSGRKMLCTATARKEMSNSANARRAARALRIITGLNATRTVVERAIHQMKTYKLLSEGRLRMGTPSRVIIAYARLACSIANIKLSTNGKLTW